MMELYANRLRNIQTEINYSTNKHVCHTFQVSAIITPKL
jgi:hypothetical protein